MEGANADDGLARSVVDSAIAIHRALGPGLLESAYVAALQIELGERHLSFVSEMPIHGSYRDRPLGIVYRADLVVEGRVLIEVKAVRSIEDIHIAQLLSYLRLTSLRLGLILNFNVSLMKNGIRRISNGFPA